MEHLKNEKNSDLVKEILIIIEKVIEDPTLTPVKFNKEILIKGVNDKTKTSNKLEEYIMWCVNQKRKKSENVLCVPPTIITQEAINYFTDNMQDKYMKELEKQKTTAKKAKKPEVKETTKPKQKKVVEPKKEPKLKVIKEKEVDIFDL